MRRNDETILVRTIAGEIHRIARHLLCHQETLHEEGESLHRGTKRLCAEEVVQWEQHVREEEQEEEEEAAMSMVETGGEDAHETDVNSPASTVNSHRRRRLLAIHHKEFIGEDNGETDDEHCLMAMERYDSGSSSQDGAPPDEEPQEREEEEVNGTTGRTGETESDEEDTNLDDDLRQRLVEGRVLPNPETTAAMGGCSNVELEHYMGGYSVNLPPTFVGYEQTAHSGGVCNRAWSMSFKWR